MGVAQKTTFSNLESLKKIFGVSGDLMEYNERGKPLKRLSSQIGPFSTEIDYTPFRKYCHRGLLNACGTFVKHSVIGLSRRKRKPIVALY